MNNPGRPRSSQKQIDILNAAAQLVQQSGYQAASMEAVASQAGVSKATLYRRWQNKAELMIAVYQHLVPATALRSEQQNFAQALSHLLQELFKLYQHSQADKILAGLIADAQNQAATLEALRLGVIEQRRSLLFNIVQQGQQQQEINRQLSTDQCVDLIVAMIWHRLLTQRPLLEPQFINTIIAATGYQAQS